ncbi:hypothetical protein RIM94_35275, partial [Pseudomonas aeruginosa]|nr:hypothetical protein [Pseudomonas aeruginosa]
SGWSVFCRGITVDELQKIQFDRLDASHCQTRNGQLRIGFGSAKHPDCRGITVDELQKIQFDRLDFTNFYEDLMNNQKIPDSGVLTQKVKEQIADQLKQAGQ